MTITRTLGVFDMTPENIVAAVRTAQDVFVRARAAADGSDHPNWSDEAIVDAFGPLLEAITRTRSIGDSENPETYNRLLPLTVDLREECEDCADGVPHLHLDQLTPAELRHELRGAGNVVELLRNGIEDIARQRDTLRMSLDSIRAVAASGLNAVPVIQDPPDDDIQRAAVSMHEAKQNVERRERLRVFVAHNWPPTADTIPLTDAEIDTIVDEMAQVIDG